LDKRYDLFLSHASEDNDFTNPLADKLTDLGLEVWYDNHDLNKSEQLREDLDNGLKKSDFGVIVLSKNYFTKGWTRLELNAWINLLVYSKKVIITIWHGVNIHEVIAFSPMISTINAFRSTMGIDQISNRIYDIIKSKSSDQSIQVESTFRYESADPQIREIQNKRFRFLLRLYELRDMECLKDGEEIGKELGYDKSTLNEISNYYLDKGLIEYPASGCVEITVWGIDYVEELIQDNPDVQKVRFNRDQVLRRLYKLGPQGVDRWNLGKELSLDEKATNDIMNYLKEKSLIEFHYSFVRITTEGIDHVENNLI
jgi:hypothetical protein